MEYFGNMNIFYERKNNRLSGFDYSTPGWYFVTICVQDMECVLGEVVNGEMVLNGAGRVVEECFKNIPKFYKNIVLDEWVVMPNHLHAIIIIDLQDVGTAYHAVQNGNTKRTAQCAVPTKYGLLSKIIKSFKVATQKQVNNTNTHFRWQRSFYDHIIDLKKMNMNISGII